VSCGDCGAETYLRKEGKDWYRVCRGCGAKAKQSRHNPPSVIEFTGGGVHGACLPCGCAIEQCECKE
jgi:hypothetical protein